MSEVDRKRRNKGWPIWIIFLPLIDLILIVRYIVYGKNISLFNPKGLIAQEQHNLMAFTITVLLTIAIPALFFAYFIAWRYRESNTKTTRNLEPTQNK